MKKGMSFLGASMFALMIFSSCGGGSSSLESDARKVADLECKAQKLAMKAASGDMSVMEESSKLSKEAMEIVEKYNAGPDKIKFSEAVVNDMKDCK